MERLEPRVVLSGDPFISEFLAVNRDSLTDEDGDSSDWIEIHNPADEPAELGNWYLTDDPQSLTKWQFPTTRINPDGYLVVFASGKDRRTAGSQPHANFKLSANGEFLALVTPDGHTIASQFGDSFPRQIEDVSYGMTQTENIMSLVSTGQDATFLVPDAEDDARIGTTWSGGEPSFDDSPAAGWTPAATGIGFDVGPETQPITGMVAQEISQGTPGTQALGGSLGTDFVVHRPITITALGAFDAESDGIRRTITVELWQRDDAGTPDQPRDDTGKALLASETFTSSDSGVLVGGNRLKPQSQPVVLPAGSYTIVARGYGVSEHNGNSGGDGPFGVLASSSAITISGAARFGIDSTATFPRFVDVGPAGRYGAGTFAFLDSEAGTQDTGSKSLPGTTVAYRTRPGLGNATFEGNLGMDFEVVKPIRVTELGTFDSGQDGIDGAVGVSLWSLTGQAGTRLAYHTFMGQDGTVSPGTGSRFAPLDQPIVLRPGFYSIVASGYLADDLYSRADFANSVHGQVDPGDGALRFVNSSRSSYFSGQDRFAERPHHRLPERLDHGPVNKWAAGTFQFETVIDQSIATDVQAQMHGVNASIYVRVAFHVENRSVFDGLRLKLFYDDGFVAYLNGTEVARRNAPISTTWNSRSQGRGADANLTQPTTVDISEYLDLLREGSNVLAIQGLNVSIDDPDFLVLPQLEGIQFGSMVERYYDQPTPRTANQDGFLGLVGDTRFSADRSIVDSSPLSENGQLLVEITTRTEGAEVYYSLDGTPPTRDTGIQYTWPLAIDETTILRAAAFKDGFIPSNVDTQTYLFLNDVLQTAGIPEGSPPQWNGAPADYEISQDPEDLARIAGDASLSANETNQAIMDSLRSLPTMSIVMDPEDLFGPVNGLYSNPFPRGRESERPASIEYILPDGGDGFQVDAGVRMMGWTSRVPGVSPKHSLRVVFRSEYGPGRLEFPLFDDTTVDSFDTIALRANTRDSWVSDYPFGQDEQHPLGQSRATASYIRDQWSKLVQRDMGLPTVAGNFVHLYLNGIYWGVYNPTERPDASFAAEHLGGSEDQYDAVTFCNPTTRPADGNLRKWNELLSRADAGLDDNASYQRILGNNPDGSRNPDFDVLIDIDNFIDYIVAGQFDAADDWPCNFYAIRRRGPDSQGFQFVTWDNDLAFPMIVGEDGVAKADVSASRVDIDLSEALASSPWRIEAALRENVDYRIRYADAVQRHLLGDGVLTPEANIERWTQLAAQIEPAMIAESARWGDYRRDVDPAGLAELYTADQHWRAMVDSMVSDYFPARSEVLLAELRSKGLVPSIDAPAFNQQGGQVDADFQLQISSPSGHLWYTLDGTDPRLPGGAINPDAIRYTNPFPLSQSVEVRARALEDDQWSALSQTSFTVTSPQPANQTMAIVARDINQDGRLDIQDLALIQANIGNRSATTLGQGDADGDGKVTRRDLVYVLQNVNRRPLRIMTVMPGALPSQDSDSGSPQLRSPHEALGGFDPPEETVDRALAGLDPVLEGYLP